MFSACFRPFQHNFGRGLDSDIADSQNDAFLWHKDVTEYAVGGDFSIAVVQANQLLEDQSQVKVGPYGTFIGVYDGHGGPEAAQFITHCMFPKIELFARELGGMSLRVLRKAFIATEEEFLGVVDKNWRTNPQIVSVGSCCLVGVISGTNLYIANLGDSRVVLGTAKKGRVYGVRLSEEHNACNVEVRQQLQAQHPDDSHIVVLKHGVWRVKGIIQVSRSIGDLYLKKPEFSRHPIFSQIGPAVSFKKPVLSADPSLHERTLVSGDSFLIFASDGLWEQMTDQEAVDMVQKSARNGVARKLATAALQRAAKKREMRYSDLRKIEPGVRRYFHDDISVVVVYLDQNMTTASYAKQSNSIDSVNLFSSDILSDPRCAM